MEGTLGQVEADLKLVNASFVQMFNNEVQAGKVRDEASQADLLSQLNIMSASLTAKSEDINRQVATMKIDMDKSIAALETQVGGSVSQGINEAKASVAEVAEDLAATTNDVGALKRANDAAIACAAKGIGTAVVGGKCVVISDGVKTATCEASTEGSSRYLREKKRMQICIKGGPSAEKNGYGYETVGMDMPKGTSASSPAVNGMEIFETNKAPRSGLWWIKPDGDSAAKQTYCDFSDKYKGYCLASYVRMLPRIFRAFSFSCVHLRVKQSERTATRWHPPPQMRAHSRTHAHFSTQTSSNADTGIFMRMSTCIHVSVLCGTFVAGACLVYKLP